jgi:hypothetical protein
VAAISNHPSDLGFQQSETDIAQIAGSVKLEPSDICSKGQAVGGDESQVIALPNILIETEATTDRAHDDGLSLTFEGSA